MTHLTDEQLSAMLDGATAPRDEAAARAHLETCAPCRESLAQLAAMDQSLGRALEHDPGDAYFETFADRVASRVAAPGAKERARPAPAAGWRAWLTPRRLALAGSAAALVVAAGLVFLDTRENGAPLQRPELTARAEQQAQGGDKVAPAEPPGASTPGEAPLQKSKDVARLNAAPPPAATSAPAPLAASNQVAAPRDEERAAAPAEPRREAASTHATGSRRLPSGEEVPAPLAAPAPLGAASVAGGAPSSAPSDAKPSKEAAKRSDQAAPSAPRSVVDQLFELKAQTAARKLEAESTAARQQRFAQPPVADGVTEAMQSAPFARVTDWPAPLRADVAAADSLTRHATERGRANEFDRAAAAWERVRERTAERTPEGIEARVREAFARGSAWTLDPLPQRREAALQAVDRSLANPPRDARAEALGQLRARLLR